MTTILSFLGPGIPLGKGQITRYITLKEKLLFKNTVGATHCDEAYIIHGIKTLVK